MKHLVLNHKSNNMFIYSELTTDFFLLDYSPSHSQIILRSKKDKNRDYNIDLLFKGVKNILIPKKITGLKVSLLTQNRNEYLKLKDYGFSIDNDYKIYVLSDSLSKHFYINAIAFGVFQNKLDILETSIGRYDMELRGENILWNNG